MFGYRNKAKLKRRSMLLTRQMYLCIFAVIALGAYLTLELTGGRRLPDDYLQIDDLNQRRQSDIDQINKLPKLPLLDQSWKTAKAIAEIHRVTFSPAEDSSNDKSIRGYSGPLRNWSAELTGAPRIVLEVARRMQATIPTFLYDYSIQSGVMKLKITVVGT
ncbi:hypothetical protein [Pseudomonas guariconensis]|uniref:hypothetical protein n=1 Tax=Pseudomonas guariconensis TaxID=1288410 RepID=UPI003905C7A8